MWETVIQVAELTPALSQSVYHQDADLETEKPGLKPDTLKWDAFFPSGGLTTVPESGLILYHRQRRVISETLAFT